MGGEGGKKTDGKESENISKPPPIELHDNHIMTHIEYIYCTCTSAMVASCLVKYP